jgi:hypothetical protein
VVTLLGRVLSRAENDLYVQDQNTVYGHLHGDWPQLQHVLRQAIHCTDNTYQAYFQVRCSGFNDTPSSTSLSKPNFITFHEVMNEIFHDLFHEI